MVKTGTPVQPDFLAELKWKPPVNAAQIGVEVNNSVVNNITVGC